MKKILYLFLLLFTFLIFTNCKKKDEPKPIVIAPNNTEEATSQFIYDIMKEAYLWYDKLPSTFYTYKYKDASETLDALLYKSLDKWSYLADAQEFTQLIDEGKSMSYGYNLVQDPTDYAIRVSYVYKNSPMDKAGIKRGFELSKINNSSVQSLISNGQIYDELNKTSNSFSFIDSLGKSITISASQSLIDINTVFHKSVFNIESKKIGYLVFNSFLNTSKEELNTAFKYFKDENISDLIVDLRYNGGGSLDVASHLAGLLAPSQSGQIFTSLKFNNKLSSFYDTTYTINAVPNGIPFSKIIFITSSSTASASELIINGLRPYIQIKLVGNTTHGKPVGMSSMYTPDKKYILVPVTFATVNAKGEGDYFQGINVDSYQKDNTFYSLGDPQEDCLKEAIHFITTNSFSGHSARIGTSEVPFKTSGFNIEAGGY